MTSSTGSGVDFAEFETILGLTGPIVAGHCSSTGPSKCTVSDNGFDELQRT